MRQVTLVAFYGQKPEAVASLIRECQQRITDCFGNSFKPYEILQVHATIVGLERRLGGLYNKNISTYRSELRKMDVIGFRDFLLRAGHIPFAVQVGGFQARDDFFASRGKTPYERSFSIQGKMAVVMGWPIRGLPLSGHAVTIGETIRRYPNTLDDIRRAAQAFNIQHSWHKQPTDVDNDFYLRVGLFESLPAKADADRAENEVREFLAQREPMVAEVQISQLYLVGYEEGEETLPWDRSGPTPLNDEDDPRVLFG